MKIEIEEKDIKDFQAVAADYYGINVTKEKAIELLKEEDIAAEVLQYGCFDTCVRSIIANAIMEDVLGEVPCEVKDGGDRIWHWPLYGSDQKYKDYFDKILQETLPLTEGYSFIKS